MQKYLKIAVLALLTIGFGFYWFHVRWSLSRDIYTSTEIMERLSIMPEDVHRITPSDDLVSRQLSMGFASFVLAQDDTSILTVRDPGELDGIWLYSSEMKVYFGLPLKENDLYEQQLDEGIINVTKSEWRQNRLLKATDSYEQTLIPLSDLMLYYCDIEPLSFWRLLFMSNWNAGYHIGRLITKLDIIPWTVKRIVPFESKHVVGVIFLCSSGDGPIAAFVDLSSLDRKISQALIFDNLPESSSDILEPVWQVLSDYKFNFETCPDIAEIRELIKESGLPESNVTVVMNCLGLESKEDLAEHLDTLISKDKNAINKFIDQSIDSEKAVKIFKGDKVIVLERNNHFVKVRRQQDATNYWILDFNLESESGQDYQSKNNKSNSELNSKPKKESANLD